MAQSSEQGALKARIRTILETEDLSSSRITVQAIAKDLGLDWLDCASVLLRLLNQTDLEACLTKPETPSLTASPKMVRYRVEIGSKHRMTVAELCKTLVDESGVDKNNIRNINMQAEYTIIELPEGMPPDIFAHLKTVEIQQRPLQIKRLKTNGKKRRNFKRNRQNKTKHANPATASVQEVTPGMIAVE
ncbi:MAG: hypothetical protein CTY29_02290 [Methylobacter sp.]|nr:MAG: hypothetical protein CTY29_02290 [Methylobacter sp.]